MSAAGDEAAHLASYDPGRFPAVAVTVDVVLLTIRSGTLSVLLVERGERPHLGAWALPGGFVGPTEDADAAAVRELAEETGVEGDVGHLEQLRTYSAPDRDPRMRVVSIAYLGLLPDLPAPVAGSDAGAARWWPLADLRGRRAPALAFDHGRILDDGLERARAKLEYTALATSFLTEPFTLSELRQVYEAVWDVDLHAANFRRKVLSTPGFVEPAGGTTRPGGGGRPAALYRRGPATALHPAMLRT